MLPEVGISPPQRLLNQSAKYSPALHLSWWTRTLLRSTSALYTLLQCYTKGGLLSWWYSIPQWAKERADETSQRRGAPLRDVQGRTFRWWQSRGLKQARAKAWCRARGQGEHWQCTALERQKQMQSIRAQSYRGTVCCMYSTWMPKSRLLQSDQLENYARQKNTLPRLRCACTRTAEPCVCTRTSNTGRPGLARSELSSVHSR